VGNFTVAANIAYTLPSLISRHEHPNDGLAKINRDPVGIRRSFVEFLRFTRLHIKGSTLTELLTHLEEHHHELMEDVIHAIGPRIWNVNVKKPQSCEVNYIRNTRWLPDQDFINAFVESARMAYAIPDQAIRNPFSDFFLLYKI